MLPANRHGRASVSSSIDPTGNFPVASEPRILHAQVRKSRHVCVWLPAESSENEAFPRFQRRVGSLSDQAPPTILHYCFTSSGNFALIDIDGQRMEILNLAGKRLGSKIERVERKNQGLSC